MMACPAGMYGDILRFENIGDWQCRDSGTGIRPKFGRWYTGTEEGFVYEWVIVVDFLVYEEQSWTYMLLDFSVIYDWNSNTMSENEFVRIENQEGYLRRIEKQLAN